MEICDYQPVIWLGSRRGSLSDWSTQLWVRAGGRRVSVDEHPWLAGPIGDTDRIGAECFRQLAERQSLRLIDGDGTRGTFFCLLGGWWIARQAPERRAGLGAAAASIDVTILAMSGVPFQMLFVFSNLGRKAAGTLRGWLAGRSRSRV